MYDLRTVSYKLVLFLHRHFSGTRVRKWQVALLMMFFVCLWWFMGVLAGIVCAFFVYLVTPDGPGRDWPALYAFLGIAFATGLFGTVKSWHLYRAKVAEIADRDRSSHKSGALRWLTTRE